MNDSVIIAENISKRYRLGISHNKSETLLGQLYGVIKAPLTNFRRLQSLSNFGADDSSIFWALRNIDFEVKRTLYQFHLHRRHIGA